MSKMTGPNMLDDEDFKLCFTKYNFVNTNSSIL